MLWRGCDSFAETRRQFLHFWTLLVGKKQIERAVVDLALSAYDNVRSDEKQSHMIINAKARTNKGVNSTMAGVDIHVICMRTPDMARH